MILMGWIILFIIFIILLLILFLLNFYRDPERITSKGNNITSPADGRIISIIDTSEKVVRIKKGLFGKIRTLTINRKFKE